jgi:hypothetical protein
VSLELPFVADPEPSALDEYLAAIDRELDALFLDEVDGVVQRLLAERLDAAGGGAGAAA